MSGLRVSLLNQVPKANAFSALRIPQGRIVSRQVCFQMTVATKDLPLLRKLVVDHSKNVSALMKVKYSPDKETAHLELYMQRSEVEHLIHQTIIHLDSAMFGVISKLGREAK